MNFFPVTITLTLPSIYNQSRSIFQHKNPNNHKTATTREPTTWTYSTPARIRRLPVFEDEAGCNLLPHPVPTGLVKPDPKPLAL